MSDGQSFEKVQRWLKAGTVGGLIGAVCIWIYEAVVWSGIQHLMPLKAIPSNATGLVFGKAFQASIGIGAGVLGTSIHFTFAAIWGIGFAGLWSRLRKSGIEATLLALGYAAFAWGVMHLAIMIVSDNHPNYSDPYIVIGGIMSHIFFTVPLAIYVKYALRKVIRR